MTYAEALAAIRARWTHPVVDPRDVEERVALRRRDGDDAPVVVVLPAAPACQVARLLEDAEDMRRRRWAWIYVHALEDVDQALDELEARAEAHAATGRRAA